MKSLKQQIKKARLRIKELDAENLKLIRQNHLLDRKLDIALARLKDISAGFYPSTYEDKWSHSSKLQLSAADSLMLIGKKS